MTGASGAMVRLHKDHVLSDAPVVLNVDACPSGEVVEIFWRLANPGPATFHGTLRLCLVIPDTFSNPWFLVPGFFYGENRRRDQKPSKQYPRFDPACRAPAEMTANAWDFAADRTAAPAQPAAGLPAWPVLADVMRGG